MLNRTERAEQERLSPKAPELAPGLHSFAFLFAIVREQILIVSIGFVFWL